MENRLAVIAIVVEDLSASKEMNEVLHEFSEYIIGRMGIPYRSKNVSLVSVALDASDETINALTGKLGNIKGLNAKVAFSKK